jgi:hypothetical protein
MAIVLFGSFIVLLVQKIFLTMEMETVCINVIDLNCHKMSRNWRQLKKPEKGN